MKKEKWKKVKKPKFLKNRIMISNYGRIYSLLTNKILVQGISKTGYYVLNTRVGGRAGTAYCIKVHRLVGWAFCKGYYKKYRSVINHIDGNKLNNHYTNLEWVSYKNNSVHAYNTGLLSSQIGSDNGCSKLQNYQVRFIKKNKSTIIDLYTRRFMASIFGISHKTLHSIFNEETWEHIKMKPAKELTIISYLRFEKMLLEKFPKKKVKMILNNLEKPVKKT